MPDLAIHVGVADAPSWLGRRHGRRFMCGNVPHVDLVTALYARGQGAPSHATIGVAAFLVPGSAHGLRLMDKLRDHVQGLCDQLAGALAVAFPGMPVFPRPCERCLHNVALMRKGDVAAAERGGSANDVGVYGEPNAVTVDDPGDDDDDLEATDDTPASPPSRRSRSRGKIKHAANGEPILQSVKLDQEPVPPLRDAVAGMRDELARAPLDPRQVARDARNDREHGKPLPGSAAVRAASGHPVLRWPVGVRPHPAAVAELAKLPIVWVGPAVAAPDKQTSPKPALDRARSAPALKAGRTPPGKKSARTERKAARPARVSKVRQSGAVKNKTGWR